MSRFVCRFIVIGWVIFSAGISHAQSNDLDDIYDEFGPLDINITDGGTLNILSGGTLSINGAATFNMNGALTITGDIANALRVSQADESNVFTVDSVNADLLLEDASGNDVFFIDSSATNVSITTAANNSAALNVVNSGNNTVFAVNTATDSVSIRRDLTLGTGQANPIIDVGTGSTLFIFPPGGTPAGRTLEIQGDISLSGSLWNPAIFEMQSGISDLSRKTKTLGTLEKRIDQVNKEIATMKEKESSLLSAEALQFVKALSAGRFPNEALFEKGILVKGNMAEVKRLRNGDEVVSFPQESARALISDVGTARLIKGFAMVELDPRFLEMVTINETTPFFVQLTAADDCNGLFVSGQTPTAFSVSELKEGKSNTPFYWRIEAVKRGFEGGGYLTPEQYKKLNLENR